MGNSRLASSRNKDEGRISEVLERYRLCYDAYMPWFREWVRAYEAVRGNNKVDISDQLDTTLMAPFDPDWKDFRFNLIKRIVETAVAKVVPTEFSPQTQPNGLSQEAKRRAAGQDYLLSAISHRVNFTRLIKKAAYDLLCTNRAIVKTVWVDVEDKMQPPSESPAGLSDISVWGGYIHCYNVHPLRFLPAPWSTETSMPWVIEVHSMHRDQMEEMFHWVDMPWDGAEKAANVQVGRSGLPVDTDTCPDYLNDTYVVYELYELPSRKHPMGRHVKLTRGKVLYDSGSDKDFAGVFEFPYSFAYIGDGENGIVSEGMLEPGLDAQDELNSVTSAMLKHVRESMSMPWVFQGKVPAPENWNNVQAIRLDAGQNVPKKMQADPLPQEVFSTIGMLQSAIQETIGLHDVSMGQAPKNIESGRGIELLAELDQSSLSRLADAVQLLSSLIWRRMVVELKLNPGSDPQAIPFRYFDKSYRFGVEEFFLSKLTDNDVVVRAIPGYLNSPSVHRQQMLQAVQLGIITDPEEVREALGLPNTGNDHDEEIWFAQNENRLMTEGVAVGVTKLDQHGLHIRVHRQFRRSEDILRAAAESQEGAYVAAFLDAHIDEHMRRVSEAAAAAQGGAAAGEAPVQQMGGNESLQAAPPEMLSADASGVQTEEFAARGVE